jgi:hypothetical protein
VIRGVVFDDAPEMLSVLPAQVLALVWAIVTGIFSETTSRLFDITLPN